MAIRFYDIIITFFLDANSYEHIDIWDQGFINRKKPPRPGRKQRKKQYISIGKKSFKLDKKTRRKTWVFN